MQWILCYTQTMKFVEIQKILPDVLLDIRYASTYNFVGEKIDGYIDPIAIGTIELVQALQEVKEAWIFRCHYARAGREIRPVSPKERRYAEPPAAFPAHRRFHMRKLRFPIGSFPARRFTPFSLIIFLIIHHLA